MGLPRVISAVGLTMLAMGCYFSTAFNGLSNGSETAPPGSTTPEGGATNEAGTAADGSSLQDSSGSTDGDAPITSRVVSFRLVTPSNDPIPSFDPLNDGTQLSKAALGPFAVEALASPAVVSRVVFSVNGTEVQTEHEAPYILEDEEGTWSPEVGSYVIEARPVRGSQSGTPLKVNVTVVP